ncbi:amidohydrolase family protein [Symbioplanes lichenis]|uniref:amidohydrolase family protein n=1 Tax=Symbioplanes lichenis TaxID=1629072 RepID=UPI00273965A0|nr:amidohydrolase family protein [Actinoplanes lichenis]
MSATLYREAALTDARSDRLRVPVSVLVEDGRISRIRPAGDEGELPRDCEIVEAGGTTIVPGLVDGHNHVTLPGGSHWIADGERPTEWLLEAAEHNGELLHRAGVRWIRDVGAVRRRDGDRERALSLGVRERWRGRRDRPVIRAAGTWLTASTTLPPGLAVEAGDADALVAAALGQLDDGADLVKLYLDGPDKDVAPWTPSEVRRVVDAVHARGATVTAHATGLANTAAAAAGRVDCIEHGFELDADVAAAMAAHGTRLVTTMAVLKSWLSFGTTTTLERFTGEANRTRIRDRLERAKESARLAHAAGVRMAGGTDAGGGSVRANHLPWEVETLVEAGLQPWEALACVTWRGGELLGEPDAGVLREGGPAGFFLVHGDPTVDPSALWRVWRVA